MYSMQRLPSASSDGTNASGSTDQTNLSFDEVIVDETEAADLYTEQSAGLAEQAPRTSAVDSFSNDREMYVTCEPYFGVPYQTNGANSRNQKTCRSTGNGIEEKYNLESNICQRNLDTLFEEFSNVRKSYERLKKFFISLMILNVLLFLCVMSLMPVTVVSWRKEGNQVTQNTISFDSVFEGFVLQILSSQEAAEIIRKNVFCSYCGLPKEFKSDFFENPEEIYDEECCDQDMFTLFRKAKANFSKSVTEFKSEIGKMHRKFNRMEDAVVGLEEKVYPDTNETGGQQPRRKSRTTILHQKVKNNNELLNILLNRERSLIQMTGTVCNRSFMNYTCGGNEKITWVKDFSTGDRMFSQDNLIVVTSGGTYFIYAKIQFSKQICNRTEMLQYRVMKQDERTDIPPEPVAHAKQSCTSGGTLEQALTVQKLLSIDRDEKARFYIQLDTSFHSYLSDDLKIHHFGIFEI